MGKKQTTTAQTEPWRAAQPMLQDAIQQAQQMGVGGFRVDPYQGQRVAQYSPMTMAGIDALGAGSTVTPAARQALMSNLNMDETYRDFDTIRSVTADNVKAQLASTFAGGGINSGMAGDTYTRAMTEALGGLEFGAYNDAKARQMQALGLAPSITGMERADAGGMLTAGGLLDQQSQRMIDADMSKYYETQNADMDALMKYSALAQGFGGMGGSSVRKDPVSAGQVMSDIGTGLGSIGTALAFFSDERLKKNIVADGDRHVYEYIWSPIKFRGDLSKNIPERVIGKWLGFDVVEVR